MKRASALMENGLDADTANATADKFESMDDETFAAMTSLFAGKMPPWLEKIKKRDDEQDKEDEKEKAAKKDKEDKEEADDEKSILAAVKKLSGEVDTLENQIFEELEDLTGCPICAHCPF